MSEAAVVSVDQVSADVVAIVEDFHPPLKDRCLSIRSVLTSAPKSF